MKFFETLLKPSFRQPVVDSVITMNSGPSEFGEFTERGKGESGQTLTTGTPQGIFFNYSFYSYFLEIFLNCIAFSLNLINF